MSSNGQLQSSHAHSRTVVSDTGNHVTAQLFTAFCDGFEQSFELIASGIIKSDDAACSVVQNWFNDNRLLIVLATGIDAPLVDFPVQEHRDPGIRAQVRRDMIHCYAISFMAYAKYCQTLHRNVLSQYRPARDAAVGEIQD